MSHWNEGSITDVAARPRFHREATPIWLITACTLLGYRAPSLSRPFRYADLGCGAGFTAVTIAATCPQAEVWGFDFNPANIEIARGLAEQAGLTNIRFIEASFESLTAMSLPEFDFMAAESVLSLVSAENQNHIRALIGGHLSPGGLAYLGYHCETGWTELMPLHTLMLLFYESGSDLSDFAMPEILERIDRLWLDGAYFFQRNPILNQRIPELRRRDAGDIASELLNRDWKPLMFANVADAMAEVKCDFAGRATLHENIMGGSVPPEMIPLLEEASSVRIKETMQDVAAATRYRRDIYRRGLNFLPVAEHRVRLETIAVAATGGGNLGQLNWDQSPVRSDPALFQPLTDALRQGPLTIAGAKALASFADSPIEEVADAVAMLIAAGEAHPVLPKAVSHEAASGVTRLNDAIIDAITRGEEIGYLVSPLLGAAIEVKPLEALTIGALLNGHKPADLHGLTKTVLMAMRRGERSVTRNGVPVEDVAEATAILRDAVFQILEHRVPMFRSLGVLGD
jgi:SAM-dependent methyltransferase